MKTSGKIAIAAAVGVAAGVVGGLLFAPAKGRDTRDLIRKKGTEFGEGIRDKVSDSREMLANIREKAGDKLPKMNHKVPESV